MSKHVATHGHKGWAGNRIGTRYLYTFDDAHAAQDQPWFRWKNDEAHKAYFAWLNARSALENGPAGLADAHSKSPDISSQSERIAVLEAALRPFADFAQWTDAEGWTSNIHREGISVWFGPSDFRRARSALAPLGEE